MDPDRESFFGYSAVKKVKCLNILYTKSYFTLELINSINTQVK